jgi:hypothetical protein
MRYAEGRGSDLLAARRPTEPKCDVRCPHRDWQAVERILYDQAVSPKRRTAEDGFADIVKALGDKPGVKEPDAPGDSARRFGSSALRVHGRIFAMVSHERLVLKLPQKRVSELIDSGAGDTFDAGKGRPMKEWVSLGPGRQDHWLDLATEAMEFVRSKR